MNVNLGRGGRIRPPRLACSSRTRRGFADVWLLTTFTLVLVMLAIVFVIPMPIGKATVVGGISCFVAFLELVTNFALKH